jgi:transglutaminase-like putative cysteine protease
LNSTARLRAGCLGLLATALASLCFTPLVHPALWYLEAVLMLGAVVLLGAGLRRLGLPRTATVLAQLLLSVLLLTTAAASSQAVLGVLPGPAAASQLTDLVRGGLTDVTQYSSPAPATPGLTLILIGAVLVVGVAVDALAATCGWAALAGLPLLAVFSIGTGLHPHDSSWLWFLLSSLGFLALLLAEGNDRMTRWGRIFRGTPSALASSPYGAGTRPLSRTGRRVALLAMAAALIVPALLPSTGRGLITAVGTGGDVINTVDPLASLQQSLNEPADQLLLSYRSTDPDPSDLYLRIVDLDDFNGTAWEPATQQAMAVPKRLPAPEGLSPDVQTSTIRTSVTSEANFGESWLPMPYPAVQVDASGDWQFEPAGRNLVGANGQTTRGLHYSVTSDAIHPTAQQLRDAGSAPASIRRQYLQLPENLPGIVAEDARAVTKDAATPYDKAVALQDWFADSGQFLYNTQVRSSTGVPAITQFLRDKQGFCVHFAATMAAMARILGIPSRVAVGFTAGTQQPDGSWQIGSKDAHAWPELYFSGAGWLRFEPTPSRGISPSYTVSTPAGTGPTSGTTGSAPTALPSAGSRSPGACPPHTPLADCAAAATTAPATAGTPGTGPSALELAWIAVGALLVLLLALPGLLRAARRERRLRRRQPPDAWREILDSAWDLGAGGPPDPAETPRAAVRRLPLAAGGGREAAERVARATERALWAPEAPGSPAAASAPLRADVLTVRAALRAPAPRAARIQALIAPRSLRRPGAGAH